MAQYCREQAFGIVAGQGKCICVADSGSFDFNQDFSGARTFQLHRFRG
jgi:hypothetical protein